VKSSRRHLDVDVEELDRVIDAAENGPLSNADRQKLKTTLHALVERLAQKRNTEKTNSVLEQKDSSSAATESPEPEPAAPAGHGRNAASAFTGAEKVSVQHAQLKPGDPCPECREGRVYRQKQPKTLIRIVGQAPLKATVFEMERLRCNACCQVFTAAEPVGVSAGKYDLTAVAMIALLKYGTGMPFNRMERLETQLGIPLPAATQWELMEPAAGSLEPILEELIRQAAQGSVVHNDDTGMRILKLVRNTDDGRTGTFTSGIVSIWRECKIALYFTVSFRQACVTAAGPTENSEKIASGYPVMPVANGLGGGVVGVDSRQLGERNGHDSTVPADEHEHFSRAGILRSHAMDFDGLPLPQR
jgi:transposase